MTYFFETYGCQMNIAESASVEQLLLSRGWTQAESEQVADMVIINTCSVRQTAENRIFGRLGWFAGVKAVRAKEPHASHRRMEAAYEYVRDSPPKPLTLVVMGCMAEKKLRTFQEEYPVIDYVVGNFGRAHFGDIIRAVEDRSAPVPIPADDEYTFAPLSYEQGSFTAFVPIMNGCNNFCTYCIVPYVRGREVSRPVRQILSELDILSSKGVKEITLLGQNVNSYNADGMRFPQLLRAVDGHLEESRSSIGWVRFLSSHPKDLSDELLDVLAQSRRLCRHIHLPVQHGSTEILRRMNRRYSREQYLALVRRIRGRLPDVSLTTDIMVGFPGETDADIGDTLDLMRQVRYESAFMYYYNPREGTPACKLPGQIPVEEKKARLQKVIDMQLEITAQEMAGRVGQTVRVLAESVSRDNAAELLGKTEQDERVAFAADKSLIGRFASVRLEALDGMTFRGALVID